MNRRYGERRDGANWLDAVGNSIVDLGVMKGVFFGNDPDADLNGDGVVNFADLNIMKQTFFQLPGRSGFQLR